MCTYLNEFIFFIHTLTKLAQLITTDIYIYVAKWLVVVELSLCTKDTPLSPFPLAGWFLSLVSCYDTKDGTSWIHGPTTFISFILFFFKWYLSVLLNGIILLVTYDRCFLLFNNFKATSQLKLYMHLYSPYIHLPVTYLQSQNIHKYHIYIHIVHFSKPIIDHAFFEPI